MAQKSNGHVALLSVHSKYSRALFDGSKKVEFRKTPFRRDISHVVIYETAPISMVVGVFELAGIDTDTPTELWRRYQDVGGIGRAEFFEYFAGRDVGVALKVAAIVQLSEPVSLSSLREGLAAPQGVIYLDRDLLTMLPIT